MAGKRKVFEDALREANNFAWDRRWKEAIAAYRRALDEFPQENSVRNNLAQAYAAAGELENALAEFEAISASQPRDPLPFLRMSDILTRLGRKEAAGEKLLAVATLAEQGGQPAGAVEVLQQLLKLLPDHEVAHERLINLYLGLDKPNAACDERLALARLYQREGQQEKAMGQVQAALQLNPRSAEARQMLDALRTGVLATIRPRAAGETPALPAPAAGAADSSANPAQRARQRALAELAEIVFERSDEPAGDVNEPAGVAQKRASDRSAQARRDALIGQALDLQTRNLPDDAIAAYVKALEAGADLPAVHLSLGVLYQERQRYAPAITHLSRAAEATPYQLGAHFALGEVYRAQNDIPAALRHFIEVLKLLDLQTVRQEQASDLLQLYETLAESYATGDTQGKGLLFIASLVAFLSSPGWEEKAQQARNRLDTLNQAGFAASLAEMLEAPEADVVLASMGQAQEYLRRKMFLSAGEECYRAIALAPGYLPLHLRLAEILLAQDRLEEAVNKFMAVADVYMTRRQLRQAIGIYRQVLTLTPMDVTVRRRLIDLLVSAGDINTALDEYAALADSHYRMAQVDQAIEDYNQALRVAGRATPREPAEARILHLLGDIYAQSVDWVKARKTYQRIVALTPADLAARQRLIEIAFKMGDRRAGLTYLDEMLEQMGRPGAPLDYTPLLRDLGRAFPQDMDIQSRLARAYQQLALRDEAIAALNALGELQLDNGRHQEAAETIRQLMALEPDKAEDYRVLMEQIIAQGGA